MPGPIARARLVGDDPSGEQTSPTGVLGLRARLEHVLQAHGAVLRRLARARTTVEFRIIDSNDAPVTLLLDKFPPRLAATPQPAEVCLELTADQARRFAAGELHVPNELLIGAMSAVGPIRRYLAVDPILRHLLRGDSATRPGTSEPLALDGGGVLPDLFAVETQKLHKQFGPTRVLRGMNLRIPEGTLAVVLGPSGTGKSVLIRHVTGTLKPDSGDVVVRGRRLSGLTHASLLDLRLDIGVMFQDGALFGSMTVFDNVAFPLRQHTNLNDGEISAVVNRYLESVGLGAYGDRLPSELSGGMKKRAGLARALVLDPGITFCDEPDSGLDPVRTALLGELLVDRHAELGGTMIVVTHNLSLARLVAEHVSVLWQGVVVEAGPAEAVFASSHPFVRQFVTQDRSGPLGMD